MSGVDLWQNMLAMGIQFFPVSRIFKDLGVGGRTIDTLYLDPEQID